MTYYKLTATEGVQIMYLKPSITNAVEQKENGVRTLSQRNSACVETLWLNHLLRTACIEHRKVRKISIPVDESVVYTGLVNSATSIVVYHLQKSLNKSTR